MHRQMAKQRRDSRGGGAGASGGGPKDGNNRRGAGTSGPGRGGGRGGDDGGGRGSDDGGGAQGSRGGGNGGKGGGSIGGGVGGGAQGGRGGGNGGKGGNNDNFDQPPEHITIGRDDAGANRAGDIRGGRRASNDSGKGGKKYAWDPSPSSVKGRHPPSKGKAHPDNNGEPPLSLERGSVMPMNRNRNKPQAQPEKRASKTPPLRDPSDMLVNRMAPVELDSEPNSLWDRVQAAERVCPRSERIFDTYVKSHALPNGSTFDAIAAANTQMDLTEFSQMAVDYGFVPELLSVEMLRAVFFEATCDDDPLGDRAHLDPKQFESSIARMVDAAVTVCVDASLPLGVMELLTILEAAHSEGAQPSGSGHYAAPQTQTPIYAWEKPAQQAQPQSQGNARSTNHPRARQRTPLRDRPGSPLRMLPNGKLARQRVLLLPNDGGLAHTPVPVIMHDTQSLLEEAARKLDLPWAARRFFTPDGIEIASLHQIHPEDVLVVSTGDDFKPRKGPVPRTRSPARTPYQYPARAVGNNDLRKAASAKSPGRRRGSPGRRMHHVRRYCVRLSVIFSLYKTCSSREPILVQRTDIGHRTNQLLYGSCRS